jgi:hypothetical protein
LIFQTILNFKLIREARVLLRDSANWACCRNLINTGINQLAHFVKYFQKLLFVKSLYLREKQLVKKHSWLVFRSEALLTLGLSVLFAFADTNNNVCMAEELIEQQAQYSCKGKSVL